ncbi:MAG: hypothetical protein ACREFL_09465 [Stellaceae bacterium]
MGSTQASLFLANAFGFYLAAKRIAEGGLGDDFPWPPFFVNVGYAFELSLKAYVLQRGGAERDCRNLGHDLKAATSEAQNRGLPQPQWDVTEFLDKINPHHRDHSFRYLRDITLLVPDADEILDVTKRHLEAVARELPELLPS